MKIHSRRVNGIVYLRVLDSQLLLLALFFLMTSSPAFAQKAPSILFPGINGDKPNAIMGEHYYSYLTELAPKLKSYGIDAVWISSLLPSLEKNSRTSVARGSSTSKNGYFKMVNALKANGIAIIYDLSSISGFDHRGPQLNELESPRMDAFDLSVSLQAAVRKNEPTTVKQLSFGHDDFHSL